MPAPRESDSAHPDDGWIIRCATVGDVPALRRLVEQARLRLFCGPALVAEIGGHVRAAVSLADGQLVADPSHQTAVIAQRLRTLRDAVLAQ